MAQLPGSPAAHNPAPHHPQLCRPSNRSASSSRAGRTQALPGPACCGGWETVTGRSWTRAWAALLWRLALRQLSCRASWLWPPGVGLLTVGRLCCPPRHLDPSQPSSRRYGSLAVRMYVGCCLLSYRRHICQQKHAHASAHEPTRLAGWHPGACSIVRAQSMAMIERARLRRYWMLSHSLERRRRQCSTKQLACCWGKR